jgi:hypothetical protein
MIPVTTSLVNPGQTIILSVTERGPAASPSPSSRWRNAFPRRTPGAWLIAFFISEGRRRNNHHRKQRRLFRLPASFWLCCLVC